MVRPQVGRLHRPGQAEQQLVARVETIIGRHGGGRRRGEVARAGHQQLGAEAAQRLAGGAGNEGLELVGGNRRRPLLRHGIVGALGLGRGGPVLDHGGLERADLGLRHGDLPGGGTARDRVRTALLLAGRHRRRKLGGGRASGSASAQPRSSCFQESLHAVHSSLRSGRPPARAAVRRRSTRAARQRRRGFRGRCRPGRACRPSR